MKRFKYDLDDIMHGLLFLTAVAMAFMCSISLIKEDIKMKHNVQHRTCIEKHSYEGTDNKNITNKNTTQDN